LVAFMTRHKHYLARFSTDRQAVTTDAGSHAIQ
jgi:hypothetical protein